MDIKIRTYKNLEWYIINETEKEQLLFLKECFTNEMIQKYFDKYDECFDVQFNEDKSKIWWKNSYIRKILNGPFLNFLDINDLNIMKTTLKLNDSESITEDYVRLITKEEIETLLMEIRETQRNYGYWTLTPERLWRDWAHVFVVCGTGFDLPGYLSYDFVHISYAVRPVISLKQENQKSRVITEYSDDYKQTLIKKFNQARLSMN